MNTKELSETLASYCGIPGKASELERKLPQIRQIILTTLNHDPSPVLIDKDKDGWFEMALLTENGK